MLARPKILISLLILGAAPLQAADPPKPEPVDPGSWVTNQDYPDEAIRAGEQGVVSFRLEVGPQGMVVGCSVTETSGSAVLDKASCDILRARARFVPAKDEKGRAVASTYESRFRWILPNDASEVDVAGRIVTRLDLAPDGSIRNCSAEVSGDFTAEMADAQCAEAPAALNSPALRPHRTKYKTIRIVFSVSTEGRDFTTDGPGWGTLLYRRGGEIHSDEHGRPIACVPLKAHAVRRGEEFCEDLPPGLEIVKDPAVTAVSKSTIDTAAFGVPNDPATPL